MLKGAELVGLVLPCCQAGVPARQVLESVESVTSAVLHCSSQSAPQLLRLLLADKDAYRGSPNQELAACVLAATLLQHCANRAHPPLW